MDYNCSQGHSSGEGNDRLQILGYVLEGWNEQSKWRVSLTWNNCIFTGLNGKIEWCEWWTCMRLNGQIEWWACIRLSRGTLLQIIVYFSGLNGKIEWCEWWTCTRLNGQNEHFLHESEQRACTRLSKAASDRKLSVSLQKCGFITGLTFLELKQAVRRLRIKLNVTKKENQQLREFLELYLDQCLIALNGAPVLP